MPSYNKPYCAMAFYSTYKLSILQPPPLTQLIKSWLWRNFYYIIYFYWELPGENYPDTNKNCMQARQGKKATP